MEVDYITEDKRVALCDWHYIPGYAMPDEGIIHCKTDFVVNCLREMARHDGPYTLVTHRSDYAITDVMVEIMPSSIRRWIAVNVDTCDSRIIAMPIGIAASRWPHGKAELLTRYARTPKSVDLLAFYATNTEAERRYVASRIKTNCLDRTFSDFMAKPMPYAEALELTASARFVLCPRGNGVDTHRVWEALYLGSVPIVKRCSVMSHFDDMGILFVDDWEDVTDDLLDGHIQVVPSRRIWMDYWRGVILS